ncbi:MAG TPA: DNA-3-methyladenine glycosylase [Candidatus Kapabacteria bacterium]|nr:DNA-3-methyladenine glycosylase [Candidatus Kapabacteria bacterium]
MRYPRRFFERPPEIVAHELLGAKLHHIVRGKEFVGRIVETEAYHEDEPACHAYNGKTERNAPLFGEAGISYVYFTYGMHYCFNVVTGSHGEGAAVLIRALEPIGGTDAMFRKRKKARSEYDLTSGPAKLCQAMGIARAENNIDLLESDVFFLSKGRLAKNETVGATTRIGITRARELPWRFFIEGNPFVSKGKPS